MTQWGLPAPEPSPIRSEKKGGILGAPVTVSDFLRRINLEYLEISSGVSVDDRLAMLGPNHRGGVRRAAGRSSTGTAALVSPNSCVVGRSRAHRLVNAGAEQVGVFSKP
jgi:hypothetical protein